MLLAVAGQTTMPPAALIGFESLSEARRQGKKSRRIDAPLHPPPQTLSRSWRRPLEDEARREDEDPLAPSSDFCNLDVLNWDV